MIIITSTQVLDPDVKGLDSPPPPPYVEPELGFAVMLTGVDGSSWDMYDGPVRLVSGARLFSTPDPEHWFKDAPGLDGSMWAGMRTPRGEPYLPVYIHEPTALDWRDTYAAFFRAVRPDGQCVLTVVTPDARSRSLTMRYMSGSNADYDVDPLLIRYGAYGLTFATEDPYWQGWPILTRFEDVTPLPRFPGPPWNINRTNTTESSSVTNPGDVDAWIKWKVHAPFTGFTVGVGDAFVTYAGAKTTGWVEIDMDPRRQTIVDETGADVWLQITAADFASIPPGPPGENADLNLNLVGAGVGTDIEMVFTPRYRQAM